MPTPRKRPRVISRQATDAMITERTEVSRRVKVLQEYLDDPHTAYEISYNLCSLLHDNMVSMRHLRDSLTGLIEYSQKRGAS